ncbi:C40 family peptidase [Nonomuraea sp. LP-02]|uniref:C40 family peptidase n=1 Tax=Nonomuraea sp. LP-02 TaxID=3097960 RepID=UPI002E33500E|nr:C40 family peptidase [Nonomuraea sp. LP-02]MED7930075.1 C40 family peptidase [Nonomuraea sp. LP-02]
MAAGATGLAVLASPAQASTPSQTKPDQTKTAQTNPDRVPKAETLDQRALTTTLTGPELKKIRDRQSRPAWKIALNFALKKQGIPYLWGGTGPGGYDCSGLMLRAYQKAGIQLPRVTNDQYAAFDKKVSWDHLKPGDLAFFSNLGHVGMISRPGYMVHAPRTGDVIKEEKLSSWRRSAFVGAVRPDRKGVREWAKQQKEPAPPMPVASVL